MIIHTYVLENLVVLHNFFLQVMEVCIGACEKYINDKRNNGLIAKNIKDALDSRYLCGGGPSPAWHVVVGERYSFEIVYEVTNLLYMFFSARLAICVWKI